MSKLDQEIRKMTAKLHEPRSTKENKWAWQIRDLAQSSGSAALNVVTICAATGVSTQAKNSVEIPPDDGQKTAPAGVDPLAIEGVRHIPSICILRLHLGQFLYPHP